MMMVVNWDLKVYAIYNLTVYGEKKLELMANLIKLKVLFLNYCLKIVVE